MKIDRDLQLELLNMLAEAYPRKVSVQQIVYDNEKANPNLHYLLAHGLIEGDYSREISGGKPFVLAGITAAGLDFLADDGGLSAIFGVVTVKLHDETIRQLLIDRVSRSDLPPEERSSLVQAIRNLPGKALGALTDKLLENGADRLVDGTPQLYTWLIQLATQQGG